MTSQLKKTILANDSIAHMILMISLRTYVCMTSTTKRVICCAVLNFAKIQFHTRMLKLCCVFMSKHQKSDHLLITCGCKEVVWFFYMCRFVRMLTLRKTKLVAGPEDKYRLWTEWTKRYREEDMPDWSRDSNNQNRTNQMKIMHQ